MDDRTNRVLLKDIAVRIRKPGERLIYSWHSPSCACESCLDSDAAVCHMHDPLIDTRNLARTARQEVS